MFKKEFENLVDIAVKQSMEFYSHDENLKKPNPFYIGFGNPNSDVLFIGKEKGFNIKDKLQEQIDLQLQSESIGNPHEWKSYVSNNYVPYKEKYYSESENYLNAYYPYSGKMREGHTWTKYNKLTNEILGLVEEEHNGFLNHVFISEVNHMPSKRSKTKVFTTRERIEFLKNDFFKGFKITILACGSYLSRKSIEDIFNVKFVVSESQPRKKLEVYRAENRTLINTRQLSMDVKNEYIQLVSKWAKEIPLN